jgi:hypothetical protein
MYHLDIWRLVFRLQKQYSPTRQCGASQNEVAGRYAAMPDESMTRFPSRDQTLIAFSTRADPTDNATMHGGEAVRLTYNFLIM